MKSDLSSSSDCSNSPGPKTPSLVARLMGLDLLPETQSPSSSSSSITPNKNQREERDNVRSRQQMQSRNNNQKKLRGRSNCIENEMRCEISGSRSLPDTPRISSARRSDVEARFSLQINKENMMCKEELDYFNRISREQKSRKKELKNEDQENRSPSHYARQIVKQVKETVSRRRVGLDITNTTTNNRLQCNEVDVVLLKSKKPKRLTKIGEESNSNKHSTSPRLRLCEERVISTQEQVSISLRPLPKSRTPPSPQPISIDSNSLKPKCSSTKPKPKSQSLPQHQTMEKCKKASCERFTQRKEGCVVVRGSKPHFSKEISNVPTSESCPTTSSSSSHSQIQASKQSSRLSSCTSRTWCVPPLLNDRDDNYNEPTITSSSSSCFTDEIRYVSEILKCTGIHKDTHVSFTTRWFSPSHPLDPSIFPHLENFNSLSTNRLKHRCNRRLIFNLIDELLANFIKPYLNMKPWVNDYHKGLQRRVKGDELLECLCIEMKKFPLLNCQTLEDIDNLIEKDLPDEKMRALPIYEESESIVFEIEQDILDSLVHETAADVIQKRRHKLCVQV
ncbi:hypothetical protein AQUCO_01300474v1 [Aquilegia coerulea]|nr:hypothetical protein AQUCO_01300474v1 [Aquilegia coerulea]